MLARDMRTRDARHTCVTLYARHTCATLHARHTCATHMHDTHARHTCATHMRDTHARHTCATHMRDTHARQRCGTHMRDTHERHAHPGPAGHVAHASLRARDAREPPRHRTGSGWHESALLAIASQGAKEAAPVRSGGLHGHRQDRHCAVTPRQAWSHLERGPPWRCHRAGFDPSRPVAHESLNRCTPRVPSRMANKDRPRHHRHTRASATMGIPGRAHVAHHASPAAHVAHHASPAAHVAHLARAPCLPSPWAPGRTESSLRRRMRMLHRCSAPLS